MVMSNETDILIVGDSSERFQTEIRLSFRHWQVYACQNPFALTARRFRRAYVTDGALAHKNWPRVLQVLNSGEVYSFADYVAPVIDTEAFEDAVLVSQLRRSRYAQDWV